MSGASVGCSRPAPCPGRTPLRRCKNRGEKKNVVFIDVDNDSFDNVIIIDVPESSERTFRAPNVLRKDRKHRSPRTGVICLDDDENTDTNFANSGIKRDVNLNTGASSSMPSHCKSDGLENSSEAVGDECQFIREDVSPVKLSKCKRTYSGKTSVRNRYGLSTDTDNCMSDSDYPDCELMEDSFGRVREQWEKASSRRKCDTRNGQSGVGDRDSIFGDTRRNVDGAYDCGQHKQTLFEGMNGEEKEPPPPPASKEDINVSCSYNYGKQTFNEDDDYGLESILKTHFPPDKDNPPFRMNPFAEGPSCYTEILNGCHFGKGISSSYGEEQGLKRPSSFACQGQNSSQVNHVEKDVQDRRRTPLVEPCLSKEEPYAARANLSEPYISHPVDSVNGERGRTRSSSEDREKIYQETPSTFSPHHQWARSHKSNGAEKEIAPEKASSLKSGLSAKHISNASFPNNDKDELVPGRTSLCRSSVSGMDSSDGKICYPDKFEHSHKNPLVSNSHTDAMQTGETVKSVDNSQEKDKKLDPEHGEIGDAVPNVEDCIISEREKLKETDEYKRAIEEEWASRQRALQIQAEEAQQLRRLRKRRKAESLRLLDMERRQKQRVEEIRETQKKDEENMNLKDVIRAQVIKQLNQLEVRCHDMTSLLRGLGAFVSNAVNPSSDEVRAAYKRALLTFHPDRASRSDIRQLVEAEEKFKLISRMKEKLLPVSE